MCIQIIKPVQQQHGTEDIESSSEESKETNNELICHNGTNDQEHTNSTNTSEIGLEPPEQQDGIYYIWEEKGQKMYLVSH